MKLLAAAVALGLLLPTTALAQKVSFDYDKTVDFTKYKTYSMKDGTKVGDPLIDKRIVDALDATLKAKGLTRNDAKPDMVVVYHVAFDKEKNITSYSSGMGYGAYGYHWGGGMATTDTRVYEILVGTLVIDMADTATNSVVFRGIGVKEVDVQAKADKRDKSINNAVTKILKDYPPKPKKK
jgi:hypothetical protein